jgi:hypothetical protein
MTCHLAKAALCLACALLPLDSGRTDEPNLSARVNALLDQLKDPDPRKAGQAEADLVRLGPEVLSLLPNDLGRWPENPRRRLSSVKAALKAITPSAFTLKDNAIPLTEALQQLTKQTGIPVSDLRSEKTNPRLSLSLEKVTFWQGLDAITRQARAAISYYQGNGSIALVDGTYRPALVSYSGLFRIAARRVTMTQDLVSGARLCTVNLEVSWEPRLQPFRVEYGASKISFTTAENKRETIDQEGTGHSDAHGGVALDFDIRLPAPPRSVPQLDSIAGGLSIVTPCKMLTFSFDELSKIEGAAQEKKLVQEGVTARITRLNPDDDPWDVEITLDNPGDGAKFESYQSWLVNNEIFLENKKTKARVTPRGMRILRGAHPHARILYYFGNARNRLGKPADWKLVTRTPGRIVTLPVRFELKDVPLP